METAPTIPTINLTDEEVILVGRAMERSGEVDVRNFAAAAILERAKLILSMAESKTKLTHTNV